MKKRVIITLLLSIIVFSGAYIFLTKYLDLLDANAASEVIKGVDLGENNIIEQRVKDELLFLVVGVDYNEPGLDPNRVRTDSMMIAKLDTVNKKIDLISVPRDSRVRVRGELDKVNHAHAYGGMALTLRTLREWLNIDLDYFVKMDNEAVYELVNAMGGVYVDVPVQIDVDDIDVHLKPGYQLLNGNQAAYLVRFREGYENGDLDRINTQQNMIKQIMKQALSVENLPKIGDFFDVLIKRVETNIPMSTMLSLLPLAGSMSSESITSHTIPGEAADIDETSYFIPDEMATKNLMEEVLPAYILNNRGE